MKKGTTATKPRGSKRAREEQQREDASDTPTIQVDATGGGTALSAAPQPPTPTSTSTSTRAAAPSFGKGRGSGISSLLAGLPMDQYPFSLMPIITDFLQQPDVVLYPRGPRRPVTNARRDPTTLRIFPIFTPFCTGTTTATNTTAEVEGPPSSAAAAEEGDTTTHTNSNGDGDDGDGSASNVMESEDDNEGGGCNGISSVRSTYYYLWMFQNIVLPTRFGHKYESRYEGEVPPSHYFPQPPTDEEVEAFYTHPEVVAFMPKVTDEQREEFRRTRPIKQMQRERRVDRRRIHQGGCWMMRFNGGGRNNTVTSSCFNDGGGGPLPINSIVDSNARDTCIHLLKPSIPGRDKFGGVVGLQVSEAVTRLAYIRNSIFDGSTGVPRLSYSNINQLLGVERGLFGGYDSLLKGMLYFEMWWGWGGASNKKVANQGLPRLLSEHGYADDARSSASSAVVYVPATHFNALATGIANKGKRRTVVDGDGSDDDERGDLISFSSDDDSADSEGEEGKRRPASTHTAKDVALREAKQALRKVVLDDIVLARPLPHLRQYFPITKLEAQVEVSVQTEGGGERYLPLPPLVTPSEYYNGMPWKLEENGGLSTRIESAFVADQRPLPVNNYKLHFVDPSAEGKEDAPGESSSTPRRPPRFRKSLPTKWARHRGEGTFTTGGVTRCMGVQTEWEDLPIPPPHHLKHYFPPQPQARQ